MQLHEWALIATVAAAGVAALAFWIWMLVDCLRNEDDTPQERLVWTLLILLTKGVGAVIYYFVRYRRRSERTGEAAAAPGSP